MNEALCTLHSFRSYVRTCNAFMVHTTKHVVHRCGGAASHCLAWNFGFLRLNWAMLSLSPYRETDGLIHASKGCCKTFFSRYVSLVFSMEVLTQSLKGHPCHTCLINKTRLEKKTLQQALHTGYHARGLNRRIVGVLYSLSQGCINKQQTTNRRFERSFSAT